MNMADDLKKLTSLEKIIVEEKNCLTSLNSYLFT